MHTPYFKVSNGNKTDIHAIVKPVNEALRELTIACNVREDSINYIVTACNSHEALLEALEDIEALTNIEKHKYDTGKVYDPASLLSDVHILALAAIEAAERR